MKTMLYFLVAAALLIAGLTANAQQLKARHAAFFLDSKGVVRVSFNGGASWQKVGKTALSADEFPSAKSIVVSPNPAEIAATVKFSLPERRDVTVTLSGLDGTKIMTLAEGNYAEGEHTVPVRADALMPGAYICTVKTATSVERTLILVQK